MRLDVQGIGKDKVYTDERAVIKLTLGWELVYEFEVWIMPHFAGVDVILGSDFMMPAGVRLNLFRSTMQNPDEVVVPLIKAQREVDELPTGKHVPGGPTEALDVPPGEVVEFKLQRNQPSTETHQLWVRRSSTLIPTVLFNKSGRATWVKVTNVSDGRVWCPAHYIFAWWVPIGELPITDGFWKKLDEARGVQDSAMSAQVDEISSNYCASDTSRQIAHAACSANAVSIGTSSETGLHGMETTDTRSASERSSTNTDPRIAVDDIWRASDLIGTLRQQAQVRALRARPDLIRGTFLDDGMGGATEPVYVTVAGLQEFDEEISNNSLADDPLDDRRLRYIASANALISSEEASDALEILWSLPAWDIVIAASAHLSSTTVNIAEYTGMNNGVKAALDHGVTDLTIVSDSRLAIQQSMGVIACRKATLQVQLMRHKELTTKLNSVRYLHAVRPYNASADSLATEALASQVTSGASSRFLTASGLVSGVSSANLTRFLFASLAWFRVIAVMLHDCSCTKSKKFLLRGLIRSICPYPELTMGESSVNGLAVSASGEVSAESDRRFVLGAMFEGGRDTVVHAFVFSLIYCSRLEVSTRSGQLSIRGAAKESTRSNHIHYAWESWPIRQMTERGPGTSWAALRRASVALPQASRDLGWAVQTEQGLCQRPRSS
ncbi:unnamed protein product [Phytophthora lilii]|uniref:Unnamed protein product n=1 Tax=Phytophthora lilii TaxID=2077276 RepID=A0A9W6TJR2_9STRA|nr:unnamed protein product [Phytophthora lilii]